MSNEKREHDVEDCFASIYLIIAIICTYLFIVKHDILSLIFAIAYWALFGLLLWMDYDIIKHPEEWESALD